MYAKQLRLGNLVLFISEDGTKAEYEIKSINNNYVSFRNINTVGFNEIEYVPITEEWLLKVGFYEKYLSMSKCKIFNKGLLKILLGKNKVISVFIGCQRIDDGTRINKAHQIQNLYLELTGNELITKSDL